MNDSERQLLTDLRRALLPLHRKLLEWERTAYERTHGRRMTGAELLKVIVADPQFAWLHPMSELIVHIDETLDTADPDTSVNLAAIVGQARRLVAPETADSPYAQRYLAALQEVPDVVIAHRGVTSLLNSRETLH